MKIDLFSPTGERADAVMQFRYVRVLTVLFL